LGLVINRTPPLTFQNDYLAATTYLFLVLTNNFSLRGTVAFFFGFCYSMINDTMTQKEQKIIEEAPNPKQPYNHIDISGLKSY